MTSLTQWYNNISLPKRWGDGPRNFVAVTAGVLSNLDITGDLKLKWIDIPGALGSYEHATRTITLSKAMFSENQKERYNPAASIEEAITAGTGVLLHELGHLLWTAFPLAEEIGMAGVPVNKLSAGIANIVEDLYVENEMRNMVWTGWIISGMWQYMTPLEAVERARKEWDGEKTCDYRLVLNAMKALRNWDIYQKPRTLFEKEIFDLCAAVRSVKLVSGRANVISELYKLIVVDDDNEDDNGDEKPSAGDNGESADGQSGDDWMGNADNITFEDFSADGKETSTLVKIKTKQIATQVAGDITISDKSFGDVTCTTDGDIVVEEIVEECVDACLEPPKAWTELGNYIEAMSGVRYIPGTPKSYGRRMSHLQNTFTNGRIFSTGRIETNSAIMFNGKPEVIVLLDLSSSMDGAPLKNTVLAAYGASKALEKGAIDFAIYGFTTSRTSRLLDSNVTGVFRFKSFSESGAMARRRLSNVDSIYTSMTPDAQAINYVGGCFKSHGTKVLIVITDGDGDNVAKSINAVAFLRKKGVNVFAVSIDQNADETCRRVYGNDNVVCNTDPNVLAKVLQKTLR